MGSGVGGWMRKDGGARKGGRKRRDGATRLGDGASGRAKTSSGGESSALDWRDRGWGGRGGRAGARGAGCAGGGLD